MNTPFFSVIVVCYNAGEKLHKTIASILGQSCGDFEIIVKDAGSTDGSIKDLPVDERIRLISKPDQGIYDGMNEAVQEARGEVLYFLNCGDYLHDAKVLEQVYETMEATDGDNPYMIFYGDVIEETSGQHVMANPQMDHFAMYRYLPSHQACFYKRDCFAERGFDLQYRVRADYEHFLWCVIRMGYETRYLDRIIADYEGGGFSETREGRERSAREHQKITRQYFDSAERFRYKAYLILTLQPLREKIAQNPATSGFYDRIKNAVYRRKSGRT